jgi:hypothetical protein
MWSKAPTADEKSLAPKSMLSTVLRAIGTMAFIFPNN